ncbi:MAG: NADH-quinone oxidoreductase subunit NuoE [Pirellulales bacterium]|nr:NADH-quinone oxidoreductase subunit NuoE [Pirellulales bacterium]
MPSTTDNWEMVEADSRAVLGEDIAEFIDECRKDEHPRGLLIAVLHKVQAKFGFLDGPHLDAVAQLLRVPAADVSGVASFYHYFRLKPRGKYMIHICMGTACFVKGADLVAAKLKDELGITFGETSPDGMFSLEGTRCIGTCGLAPVMMIDENVHAEVTPDKIPVILEEYLQKARAEKE